MKNFSKLMICITFIAAAAAAFFAGSHLQEQAHIEARAQRCQTLLTFAIDKAGTETLADQDMMEALISNVYAAYQFCDDPHMAAQLHDLWNELLVDGEHYAGREDTLTAQLQAILNALQITD